MFASIFGRTDNVKFWLDRFPDWDLERKNKLNGGVALGCAVFMGPDRLELVKILLNRGASIDHRSDMGGSILTSLCECEDGSPELLHLLLDHMNATQLNRWLKYQVRGSTLKWRTIRRLACFLARYKLADSGLLTALAHETGSTGLYYAVQRGDVDIVNILLRHGADPTIKNILGKSPVDYCDAFPELSGALKRVIKQRSENKSVTLHRRNSTATNMKFPMYLVPLDQLHRLYGGKNPRHERIEAHQKLKQRGELVRWEDLPFDANIIFLSHEWVGWNHPDPHGIQLKTFLKVMKRLESGKISQVEMNVFHTMMYKTNLVMRADEWKEMLSTTYVWIDWASMPQPSACPPSVPKDEKKKMETDLGNAVKSIPAYVISTHTHKQTTYLIHQHSRTGT
jgi:ankyrin repeat protein